MKWTGCIVLFFLFLYLSCGQKKDTLMTVINNPIDTIGYLHTLKPNRWYKTSGNVSVDSICTYKNEKSLRLTTSGNDTSKVTLASFLFDLGIIDGDTLVVEGKYKLREATDAKISFRIIQDAVVNKIDSLFIEPSPSNDWKKISMKTAIGDETGKAVFRILGKGDIDILISNCRAWVDGIPLSELVNKEYAAEKDTEYDNGSRIELGELTAQMAENLEIFGKVWGFLKYYHPKVTQGNYNWDYEMFRVLPHIANANDKEQRNKLLNKWIDKYGKIKDAKDYSITDSTKYSRFIDLDWLNNRDMFDEQLIMKFHNIKNASRSKKLNYYAVLPFSERGVWNGIEQEKPYKSIQWNDQGYRILTLFRLWNVIEYCFPYTHYTDTPWETLLKDFLPKFVNPNDQANYELAIMELGAKIDDSHGYLIIPNNKLHEVEIAPTYGKYHIPIELTQSAEGFVVVKTTESEFFHRGDIIISIEGREINDIIEGMSPYISASNRNGMIRNILYYLIYPHDNQKNVEVIRDGKRIKIHVKHFRRDSHSNGIKTWKEYNLEKQDIIHVDNIKSEEENKDIVQNNMNSKGLIIDMRRYPYQNNQYSLFPLLLSKYPLWISGNDKSFPGNYRVSPGYDKINETEKEPNYKGKIVILVDEHTQSAGETWSMQHRLAPNSIIVGRQTAGANGNVGKVYLPGNIEFSYSQYGAYYPNWEILQRKGVKIDVIVSPTVDEIKAGRDVWIEKAIEIITKN